LTFFLKLDQLSTVGRLSKKESNDYRLLKKKSGNSRLNVKSRLPTSMLGLHIGRKAADEAHIVPRPSL
jgi:hypothetical protein